MAAMFRASCGPLAAALALAALPVSERQARLSSALAPVRLVAEGEALAITSTSYDASITCRLRAAAQGEVAMPFERLANLLRHFPAEKEITIGADDRAAVITAGRSRFKLPVVALSELRQPFALGVETGRAELDAKVARDLFTRPAFAAASDVSRAYLSGILLHSNGKDLIAAATEGLRLCRVTASVPTSLSSDRSLIIPNRMVRAIGRLLGRTTGSVTLRRSDRLFAIEGKDFLVVSSRIDATYPDYERVIPPAGPNLVTTDRARLTEALARFVAVADPQASLHIVRLRWGAGGLHLYADGSDDFCAADVVGEAETAVQTNHFVELINALRGDHVRISVGGPGSMIVVTDPDDPSFFAGQMPIRPRSS
ncbi:DNA polymerase III subunit beta [Bradyrhizobium sp. WYCCWR 13023]|uniref:Beta sliding clamp n=1 Tax=Bradyrhizobium zhengyangense TaxID=2911009 RepID=A0A9X1RK42_9BRAD|nr:DNA polymerase III subunit beta [Bradyrhizobium zhengyangense]MCG2632853.1 DNA polymerase III subunit beta [Bradyrhizobium zhengyangense]